MSNALTVRPPLTPLDCDLRDFGHMPLDVRKFRDSDLVALEEPEAIVAAIMLWGASWHQIPAASLPSDDRVLAQLAGYGRAVPAFRKVKDGALRGFVQCSDGRLYHPLVAEKARTAWEGKLRQRWRTFCAAVRKHNERHKDNPLDAPEFETWEELGRPEKVAQLAGAPRNSGPLFEETEEPNVACDNSEMSHVTSRVTDVENERDMASKGKGERKGKGKGDSNNTFDNVTEGAEDLLAMTARIAAAGGVSVIVPSKLTRAMDVVKAWRAENIPVETILDVIAKRLADMPPKETVSSLSYFDAPLRKALALKGNSHARPTEPPPTLHATDDNDPRVTIIRDRLKATLGPSKFNGWLGPNVAAFSLNGRAITVTTPSAFMADWVERHFADDISRAADGLDVKVTSE